MARTSILMCISLELIRQSAVNYIGICEINLTVLASN